jgi:hypothetical protein
MSRWTVNRNVRKIFDDRFSDVSDVASMDDYESECAISSTDNLNDSNIHGSKFKNINFETNCESSASSDFSTSETDYNNDDCASEL